MTELTLRPTIIAGDRLEGDYCVYREGRAIGRIREATERIGHNPGWDWSVNPPLPIPTWGKGSAGSFDDARADFCAAWERFHATLTGDAIAHWHHHQDAAATRFGRA
jgi:hypothetical protein